MTAGGRVQDSASDRSRRHNDRVVLVTGGAGGIGSALVERYLAEGARVAVVELEEAALKEARTRWSGHGDRVAYATADVGDYDACAVALQRIEAALGSVDTAILNAGISPKHAGRAARIEEMDPGEWRQVTSVNLDGAFNLARLLAPGMNSRKFGRIVTMSSVSAKIYAPFIGIHYATTKGALLSFTRHLAGELGPHGITANGMAPGRIRTPMIASVGDAINQGVIDQTALRRLGEPEEVAAVSTFLTSEEASFVTGQVIDVAGGLAMT